MQKPIKVLIIGMSPIKGGIEMLLIQFFRGIDRSQVQFDFLTFCEKCAFEEEILAAGSQVFHMTRRGENPVKNRKELIAFFKAYPNTYDYIWYHLSSASNCAPVVLARKYTTAKIICHSHGTSFDSSALFRPIHLLLDKINSPRLMRSTDYCFACSKAAGDWLFKGTDREIKLIRNGVRIEKFRFDPTTRARLREELKAEDAVVIGHAGRFCAAKNQSFIIDIFSAYHRLEPNSVLVLVGEGETKSDMEEKVRSLHLESAVRFLGFREDFNALLQAFDLFLMPSLYEGLPISAVEAQTSGLPCLLADTITDETAVTDLTEFLSLSDSAAHWAQKIQEMLSKSVAREPYAQAVRDAGYDAEDTISDVAEFFCGSSV